ncbi:MAG: hypothetical protein K2O91_19745 [Lachnospiraceae bacterium]|nr:hypothetical protein [Lachnospiraceae bacterium]
MSITDSMIKIADWLNETVSPNYKFKVPPDEKLSDATGKRILAPMDDGYQYKEVNPYAFAMFLPTKDKIPPPKRPNMPSMCVQFVSGSDDLVKERRDMNINIACSCWNPGIHIQDIYYPKDKWPDKPPHFEPAYTGWMDVWNLVDGILERLEAVNNIGHIQIAQDTPVTFGCYKEQDNIPDFYPFWFAWVQFKIRSNFIRNNEKEKYL